MGRQEGDSRSPKLYYGLFGQHPATTPLSDQQSAHPLSDQATAHNPVRSSPGVASPISPLEAPPCAPSGPSRRQWRGDACGPSGWTRQRDYKSQQPL